MKARTAGAGDRTRTPRYATVAEVKRLKRELAEVRRNPLVRLGGAVGWAHLWRGVFSVIVLGGSLAEILRLVMGR